MPAEPPTEHLIEIAAILAAGLLRLRGRKSSPNSPFETDSQLDCARGTPDRAPDRNRRHFGGGPFASSEPKVQSKFDL